MKTILFVTIFFILRKFQGHTVVQGTAQDGSVTGKLVEEINQCDIYLNKLFQSNVNLLSHNVVLEEEGLRTSEHSWKCSLPLITDILSSITNRILRMPKHVIGGNLSELEEIVEQHERLQTVLKWFASCKNPSTACFDSLNEYNHLILNKLSPHLSIATPGEITTIIRLTLNIQWTETIIPIIGEIIQSGISRQEKLRLAIKLKSVLDEVKGKKNDTLNLSLAETFSKLRDDFSSDIKASVWGAICQIIFNLPIRPNETVPYPLMSDTTADYWGQRKAYFWHTTNAEWEIEPTGTVDGLFKIKSIENGHYLGALLPEAVWPVTQPGERFNDSDCLFGWMALEGSGDYIKLFHVASQRYMYYHDTQGGSSPERTRITLDSPSTFEFVCAG